MKEIAEETTGKDLDPFFDVFFRETEYPFLHVVRHTNDSEFYWVTENDVPLDLNVPLLVNGEEMAVEMTEGYGNIDVSDNDELVIDPENWILMDDPTIVTTISEQISSNEGYRLKQNYPNPFSRQTNIEFFLPLESMVNVSVYDIYGKRINTLVDQNLEAGEHRIDFDGSHLQPGLYLCVMEYNNQMLTIKMSVR
jgi:hypothetical protein